MVVHGGVGQWFVVDGAPHQLPLEISNARDRHRISDFNPLVQMASGVYLTFFFAISALPSYSFQGAFLRILRCDFRHVEENLERH